MANSFANIFGLLDSECLANPIPCQYFKSFGLSSTHIGGDEEHLSSIITMIKGKYFLKIIEDFIYRKSTIVRFKSTPLKDGF